MHGKFPKSENHEDQLWRRSLIGKSVHDQAEKSNELSKSERTESAI